MTNILYIFLINTNMLDLIQYNCKKGTIKTQGSIETKLCIFFAVFNRSVSFSRISSTPEFVVDPFYD